MSIAYKDLWTLPLQNWVWWIAADENGDVHLYDTEKPIRCSVSWAGNYASHLPLDITDIPPWKDSLMERPKPVWHWPEPDENTPVDTKVWAWYEARCCWIRSHYATQSSVYCDGSTSWTELLVMETSIIVLPNPENPKEHPPVGMYDRRMAERAKR